LEKVKGLSADEVGRKNSGIVKERMSPAQITEAQKLAKE